MQCLLQIKVTMLDSFTFIHWNGGCLIWRHGNSLQSKPKFKPPTFGSVDKRSHQLCLIFLLRDIEIIFEFKSLNLCLDIPLLQCWRQVWAAPCRWPTGVYEDHSYAPIWFWYRDFVHFLNLNVRSCAVNLKPGVQSSVFWRVFYAMTEVDVLSVGHKP